MPDRLYIQPLTFAPSPQAFAGDAVRLAGGMVYAREFAVIIRRGGEVAERAIATAETAISGSASRASNVLRMDSSPPRDVRKPATGRGIAVFYTVSGRRGTGGRPT